MTTADDDGSRAVEDSDAAGAVHAKAYATVKLPHVQLFNSKAA